MIYDIILGKSYGKCHCPFHEGDNTPSLNVASDGRFHCFACNAGGPNEIAFARQYYNCATTSATRVVERFNNLPRYTYTSKLNPLDVAYLDSIGISEEVQKRMKCTTDGKLVYVHNYKGVNIDHTWFNYPGSVTHNPSIGKYMRDRGSVSGFLTPYSLLDKQTIIIVEGEKDMLTMLSQKIPAVSIVGGAATLPYMCQRELVGKDIVIIYDCDEAGREGAETLVHWLYSIGARQVKNVDLGLQDKEDINDWFMKYGMTREELINLIKTTEVSSSEDIGTSQKVNKILRQINKQLSVEEIEELKSLLQKEEK